MKLLLRAAFSLLPFALAMCFVYDVGGLRSALEIRVPNQVTAATSDALEPEPQTITIEPAVPDGFRFDGRTYWVSNATVNRTSLGAVVAQDLAYDGRSVSLRQIDGIISKEVLAVGLPLEATSKKPVWYVATVTRQPATT